MCLSMPALHNLLHVTGGFLEYFLPLPAPSFSRLLLLCSTFSPQREKSSSVWGLLAALPQLKIGNCQAAQKLGVRGQNLLVGWCSWRGIWQGSGASFSTTVFIVFCLWVLSRLACLAGNTSSLEGRHQRRQRGWLSAFRSRVPEGSSLGTKLAFP